MISHRIVKNLPYNVEDIYGIVADVKSYPKFLPWCIDARVLREQEQQIMATLTVGYAFYRESFTSKVHFSPYERIDVEFLEGPFYFLKNTWNFESISDKETRIDFYIAFHLKNVLYQRAIQFGFIPAVNKMLDAFYKRADFLYKRKFLE